MKRTALRLVFALVAICYFMPAQAQISEGGTPPSFEFESFRSSPVPYEAAIDFDVYQLLAEDEENAELDMPLRCAYIIPVRLSLEEYGEWHTLPDGTLIWQFEIYAPGAIAILLSYEKFIIPEGGKLFLYNPEHTKVLGAYSSKTNTLGKEFATEFVYGDHIILEYVAPDYETENPELIIDGIHYGYNNLWVPLGDGNWTKSVELQPCMLNVNCPEGDDWQDQKKGVARIYCGGYLCSGSVVNNTAQDFDPYFLSAYHCYESVSTGQINQSIYYFHYESIDCTSTALGPNSKTITGAQYLVKIPWVGGSDGALLRLNSAIPDNYDVYFNGWDRRNVGGAHGVSIHHPDGAIKKISTYLSPLTSMTYNTCASNAHWRVYWNATVSGHSSTEGGSSGSPIFNENKLIVGTLSGGQASCYNHNGLDAYGKMWYHWDQHSSQKMKDYLDPSGSGVETLEGAYIGQANPVADFSWEPQEVILNKPVVFTCKSKGVSTRDWTFENGTPATSTEQNPEVVFNMVGNASVTLTINKGTDREASKTVTIAVTEELPPAADFVMNGLENDPIEIYQGQQVSFQSRSTGTNISHHWTFEGGTPAESTESSVKVTYNNAGTFIVTLKVESYLGDDTKEKTVIVNSRMPEASFASSSVHLSKYPHGEFLPYEGGKVTFSDMSENFPTEWNWVFEGANPASSDAREAETTYPPGKKSYPVELTTANSSGTSEVSREDYIQTGGTSQVWNIPYGETGEDIFRLSGSNCLTGTNAYYSTVAEKFENTNPGSIDRIDLYIKVVEGDVSDNIYGIQIYSEKNGLPDASLYMKTISGTAINADGYTSVSLGQSVQISGNFFVVVSGLASSTSGIAIGAAKTDKHTVYVRVNSQWRSLYSYFEGAWSVSMNIIPHFTYKLTEEVILPPVDVTAIFDWGQLFTQLNWTLEGNFDDIVSYKVYRDGQIIASDIKEKSYKDTKFVDFEYNCYTVVAEYGKGLESLHSEEACVFINTAIDEVSANNTISVYPNPATSSLTVESPSAIESLSIQDLQGRTIFRTETQMQSKLSVPVNQLTPGIYLVKVKTTEGTVMSKWIKK